MDICFYSFFHIGDLYLASLFINIICKCNKDINFYYYFINGDDFFKNIPNIKRLGIIEDNYSNNLINGSPPESLVNIDILNLLKSNDMQAEGSKQIYVEDKLITFVNTWCRSPYFMCDDFNINDCIVKYENLVNKINELYSTNLNFIINNPSELIEHLTLKPQDFETELINDNLNETIFVFNYVPRSVVFNMERLHNFIIELSKQNKLILSCYDSNLDRENIKFIDRDFNIFPEPSCKNLIKLWEVAIKCKQIFLLPSGGSWTFFHKINEIKMDQIFMYEFSNYGEKLNYCINTITGENKNLIKTFYYNG